MVKETDQAEIRSWKGERRPSGSSLWQDSQCHGRWMADGSFPEKGDRGDANLGTIMHSYMENETPLDEIDDDNQRFGIFKARKMEEGILAEWGLNGKVTREPRFWCVEDGDGKFSGCIDRLEVDGKNASIIDYKMLFGNYAEAKKNRQLQVYGMLVCENHPEVETVYLGLIQPMLDRCTTASASRETLMGLRPKLIELSNIITKEGAPRSPSPDACKYCNAIAHCPEAYELISKIPNKLDNMDAITNEELSERMVLAPLLERYAKELKSLARDRMEKDIEIPGYHLRSSGKITTYNTAKAAEILFDCNLSQEEFLKCCTVKEPQLVKQWAKLTNQTVAKAREDLRTRLENCITRKDKSKSIASN